MIFLIFTLNALHKSKKIKTGSLKYFYVELSIKVAISVQYFEPIQMWINKRVWL